MDLRDLFIATALVAIALCALRKPQIGMLGWLWISIMNPHKESYGFIYSMPVLDFLAAFTLLGCVIHWKDRAEAEYLPVLKVLLAFYAWCTLTTIFAVNNPSAFYKWTNFSKTLLLILLFVKFMNKKHWIVACYAVFLLSLSYTGLKGGLFTIIGGGVSRVYGPESAMWGSNNGVSLAMLMVVPIILGFAYIFSSKLFRLATYGVALSSFAAILGTQSRGGFVGVLAVGGTMLLRSRRKMLALMLVPLVFAGAYFFMPQKWHDRMATILTPTEEGSARTRLIQWQYAIDISLERPFFGNGFDSFFHRPYYLRYVGDKDTNRAVHSNIFQILGEQGYIGLAMWLTMLVMLVTSSKKYALLSKGRQDLLWASALVGMMQYSVVGFFFNGLTLNLAYLDLYYYVVAFTVLLISHIRQELGLTQADQVKGQRSKVKGQSPIAFRSIRK
jgi:putative inorganic carbon (HCO3(-)) transporter